MRLGQIRFENQVTAAVFEEGGARPIPGYTIVELIRKAEAESVPFAELAAQLAMHHCEQYTPAIPMSPVEVWSADATQGSREIFFKGTARVCVGPGQPVGVRSDSKLTTPRPALALALGRMGEVIGYTLANDLAARDIAEPAQSRIYRGACALGPAIVTPDELAGVAEIEIVCTILRQDGTRFFGSARIRPPCDPALIERLLHANPVPAGSALMVTGGVWTGQDAALAPGDTVVIRAGQMGELSNPAATVQ